MRLPIGEGIVIDNQTEVRVASRKGDTIQIAVRAPKHIPIRRVK